jgi:hypothetical protein
MISIDVLCVKSFPRVLGKSSTRINKMKEGTLFEFETNETEISNGYRVKNALAFQFCKVGSKECNDKSVGSSLFLPSFELKI